MDLLIRSNCSQVYEKWAVVFTAFLWSILNQKLSQLYLPISRYFCILTLKMFRWTKIIFRVLQKVLPFFCIETVSKRTQYMDYFLLLAFNFSLWWVLLFSFTKSARKKRFNDARGCLWICFWRQESFTYRFGSMAYEYSLCLLMLTNRQITLYGLRKKMKSYFFEIDVKAMFLLIRKIR